MYIHVSYCSIAWERVVIKPELLWKVSTRNHVPVYSIKFYDFFCQCRFSLMRFEIPPYFFCYIFSLLPTSFTVRMRFQISYKYQVLLLPYMLIFLPLPLLLSCWNCFCQKQHFFLQIILCVNKHSRMRDVTLQRSRSLANWTQCEPKRIFKRRKGPKVLDNH